MDIKTPKVSLVTHTANPLETVYSVWEASKNTKPYMSPKEVKERVDPEEVRKLFRAVIEQRIPIGEHVNFVFMLENISVSWREQAVRHRIGTLPGPERVGADLVMDVIPDLATSSWWSQSMRIQNMGEFAKNGEYRVPESILEHIERDFLMAVYRNTMETIQASYMTLVAAGIPMEDARELIPLGAQHRMSWSLNIGSLQHIVGKRGCWILQLGIWGPIIMGMVEELATKVDPIFRELVTPPCIRGDKFNGCVYMEENRRRYTQDDQHAPCPLHVVHHHLTVSPAAPIAETESVVVLEKNHGVPRVEEMRKRAEDYRKFWGRDPYTGHRLPVVAE